MMDTTVNVGSDNTITGIKVDLARLEGMLSAFLTDGVRRIAEGERVAEGLRTDAAAAKELCNTNVAAVATRTTIAEANILELHKDVKDIREKQNASFGRILLIVSPIISGAALLWNMLGK